MVSSKRLPFLKSISAPADLASRLAYSTEYSGPISGTQNLQTPIHQSLSQWQELANLVDSIHQHFSQGYRALLLNFGSNDVQIAPWQYTHLYTHMGLRLGRALEQNQNGDQVILVYDRDRVSSMHKGARYHQTREGGSIHTDNVNVPEYWDYLILGCIEKAQVGGESILVDGRVVYQTLKEQFPQALEILRQNFIWEMRGVKEELYQAPIITLDQKGEPHFRHLRPYMESAHEKANSPMTEQQLYAVDILDAILNHSLAQTRIDLAPGHLLLTVDDQVLHGRTCFSDALEAVTINDLVPGRSQILKRTMARLWIQK